VSLGEGTAADEVVTMARGNNRGALVVVVTGVVAAALTISWSLGFFHAPDEGRSGPSTRLGVVPNVEYLLLGAAEQRVGTAGLTWTDSMTIGGADFSLPCHPAEIFNQSPAAETKVAAGTVVKLFGGPGSLPKLHGSCSAYVTDDVSTRFVPQVPQMQRPSTVLLTPIRTNPEEARPLAYGTAVTNAQLRMFGPPNPTAATCRGGTCWSLGTVDGCEYPLFSTNGGVTWRTGGPYFTVPAADADAFVSTITILIPGLVAAYGSGNAFYMTGDGGRTWLQSYEFGTVLSATFPAGVRDGDDVEVTTSAYHDSRDQRRFVGSMFARSAPTRWRLLSLRARAAGSDQ
jgi:hypothetical protein